MTALKVYYQRYSFHLSFARPVVFTQHATFLFRSVVGMQLRRMTCVFKSRQCNDCLLGAQCVYSFLFETPIARENTFLPGREKAAHPYVISTSPLSSGPQEKIEIEVVLLGEAVKYFPHLYYAITEAGKQGIMREQIPYAVEKIVHNGANILIDGDRLKMDIPLSEWKFDEGADEQKKRIKIHFLTPLRLKINGHLASEFTISDLVLSLYRRAKILGALYGELNGNENTILTISDYKEISRDFQWVDLNRYSSRQQVSMKMGGVVGHLDAKGGFTPQVLSILHMGELFHAGKNTSFGLGKIRVEST